MKHFPHRFYRRFSGGSGQTARLGSPSSKAACFFRPSGAPLRGFFAAEAVLSLAASPAFAARGAFFPPSPFFAVLFVDDAASPSLPGAVRRADFSRRGVAAPFFGSAAFSLAAPAAFSLSEGPLPPRLAGAADAFFSCRFAVSFFAAAPPVRAPRPSPLAAPFFALSPSPPHKRRCPSR